MYLTKVVESHFLDTLNRSVNLFLSELDKKKFTLINIGYLTQDNKRIALITYKNE